MIYNIINYSILFVVVLIPIIGTAYVFMKNRRELVFSSPINILGFAKSPIKYYEERIIDFNKKDFVKISFIYGFGSIILKFMSKGEYGFKLIIYGLIFGLSIGMFEIIAMSLVGFLIGKIFNGQSSIKKLIYSFCISNITMIYFIILEFTIILLHPVIDVSYISVIQILFLVLIVYSTIIDILIYAKAQNWKIIKVISISTVIVLGLVLALYSISGSMSVNILNNTIKIK